MQSITEKRNKMARGRMITNLICKDKKVHALSDDTARLLFTWLITVADCEGRTYGDPAIVKATIFPRRTEITAERVDGYLNEMYMLGLIVRYIVDDEQYISFPAFEKNQIGLRKDRESKSEIPAPPLRSKSGVTPEEVPVKLIEVNGIEDNLNENKEIEDGVAAFSLNELNTAFIKAAKMNPFQLDKWSKALEELERMGATPDDVTLAVESTIKNYPISGPWSILKSTAIAMSKRRQVDNHTSEKAGYTL